jgi:hypothetical protein
MDVTGLSLCRGLDFINKVVGEEHGQKIAIEGGRVLAGPAGAQIVQRAKSPLRGGEGMRSRAGQDAPGLTLRKVRRPR